MKWAKSFYLHPWVNRFNLLYLLSGSVYTLVFLGTAVIGEPSGMGWIWLGGLGLEVSYLGVRGALDRGNSPWFNLRRLPWKERDRFVKLWETVDRLQKNLVEHKHTMGAMAASPAQVSQMLRSFLELQLTAMRLDRFVLSRAPKFAEDLAKIRAQIAVAPEAEKELLTRNLEVVEKRRQTNEELKARRQTIDHRLNTIENTIRLLSDVGVGLADPAQVQDQVQVILHNVDDAESMIRDLDTVIGSTRVKG